MTRWQVALVVAGIVATGVAVADRFGVAGLILGVGLVCLGATGGCCYEYLRRGGTDWWRQAADREYERAQVLQDELDQARADVADLESELAWRGQPQRGVVR